MSYNNYSSSNGDEVPIRCVVGSLSHTKTSPTAGFHMFYIHGDLEYTILFVVPPSLAPRVNRLSSLNFRMVRWYPKIFIHENETFEILETQKFLIYIHNNLITFNIRSLVHASTVMSPNPLQAVTEGLRTAGCDGIAPLKAAAPGSSHWCFLST